MIFRAMVLLALLMAMSVSIPKAWAQDDFGDEVSEFDDLGAISETPDDPEPIPDLANDPAFDENAMDNPNPSSEVTTMDEPAEQPIEAAPVEKPAAKKAAATGKKA